MYYTLDSVYGNIKKEDGSIESVELKTLNQVAELFGMNRAQQVVQAYSLQNAHGETKLDWTKLGGINADRGIMIICNEKYKKYLIERITFLENKKAKNKKAKKPIRSVVDVITKRSNRIGKK